jgi:transposase
MSAAITLADLSKLYGEFWAAQNVLLKKRMADPAIRETAFSYMRDEMKRQVPTRFQTSIYEAHEQAEHAKQRFLAQQARKGGRAKKNDRLQEVIEEYLQRDPSLTIRGVESLLREHQGIEPIQDIDNEFIYFTSHCNTTKKAKLSGLKDRLSRAKKKRSR